MQRGHKTGLERRGQKHHGPSLRVTPNTAKVPSRTSWWIGKTREELAREASQRQFHAVKPRWTPNTHGILDYCE